MKPQRTFSSAHTAPRRVFAALLASALLLTLTPAIPPPAASAAESIERTVFLDVRPGGFNAGNTSVGLDKAIKLTGYSSLVTTGAHAGSINVSPTSRSKGGAAFLSRRIYSETGFSALFQIQMGTYVAATGYGAADGWCFVVARDSNTVGVSGGNMAYTGIKNSYAFLYDTFYNPAYPKGNAAACHPADKVPLVSRGEDGIRNEAEDQAGSVLYAPASGIKYNNAENYTIYGWVDYNSKDGTMKFYLNDTPTKPADPISIINANIEEKLGSQYYIGFTASAGGSFQETFLQQFYVFNEYAPSVQFNAAGNNIILSEDSPNAEIVEDYTPPTPPVIAQQTEGMTPTLMRFTMGGSEDRNGVRKYQYRIGADPVWHDYADADDGHFILDGSQAVATPIVQGGGVTVYARALDSGGNISEETAAELRYTVTPKPALTAPANGATNVYPENAREIVLSFASEINAVTVGSVAVRDGTNDIPFAGGHVMPNDPRWDASHGKLTLPFLGAVDYGKTYTVTVSGFVNTSGNAMNPATQTFTFSTIGREATPAAGIDYANERLTGLAAGTVYRINGGEYTAAAGGIAIDDAWFGSQIEIVKPGTASSAESAAQAPNIPARPAAPQIASIPGYITGTDGGMEYATSASASAWATCAAGSTPLTDGRYYVRYKSTASAFKSAATAVDVAAQTFTLNVTAPTFVAVSAGYAPVGAQNLSIRSSGNTAATITGVSSSEPLKFTVGGSGSGVAAGGSIATWTVQPATGLPVGVHTATVTVAYTGGRTATAQLSLAVREATPAVVIDYANEQLKDFAQGALYTVNGVSRTTGAGKMEITNDQLGATLEIVKTNANTALNSLPQSLPIPPRPAAPTGVSKVDEVYAGENGSLTGIVAAGMEYRHAGGAWQNAAESVIAGLAPGVYQVRTKATDGSFCGAAAQYTIKASKNYKVTVFASPPPTDAADRGADGRSDTKYITLTFDKTVAGLTSKYVEINEISNAVVTSVTPENGTTPNTQWRVGIKVLKNKEDATVRIFNWTDAAGNMYTVNTTSPGYVEPSVTVYKAVPETTPAAILNYQDETFTGLVTNARYAINGAERQATGSELSITEFIEAAGTGTATFTLSVVKMGGEKTVDSEPQILELPKRLPAPAGIAAVQPAEPGLNGKISGVNGTMEYRASSSASWTLVTGNSIDNLLGTYYVRTAASTVAPFAFHSKPASVTICTYGAIDFGDVYEGYAPVGAKTAPSVTDAVSAALTGTNADCFVTSAAIAVMPKDGLSAGKYTATVEFKNASDASLGQYDISFAVHKKAEIRSATPSVNTTTGLTDSVTISFEHAIALDYSDVVVQGGAVKTGNDFTAVSGDKKTYTLAVTPLLSAADGAAIKIKINLESNNLKDDYAYQLARSGGEALASNEEARVRIPRAIESASVTPNVAGFSSGVLQFTLKRGTAGNPYYPINVDAIEEKPSSPDPYSGKIKIRYKDSSDELTGKITEVARVDADLSPDATTGKLRGYTYRVLFIPTRAGEVEIFLPGFGINEWFPVENAIVKEAHSFSEASYFLSETGRNFLTSLSDTHQNLSAINLDPSNDPNARPYAAPAYTLRLDKESDDWTLEAFYVDGRRLTEKSYPGPNDDPATYFTVGNETNRPYIFDGDPKSNLAKQLTVTLPAGWTNKNGTHTFHAVLKKNSTAEYSAAIGKIEISGIVPIYTLTVENGTGSGEYPAGARVQIAGREPASGEAFVKWTITLPEASVSLLRPPTARIATITMPMEDATFTANYGAAPIWGISLDAATLAFPTANYGYGAVAPATIRVTNTGSRPTGRLAAELTAGDADSFTLSSGVIDSIAVGGSATFTAVPKQGLASGSYVATVTVSGDATQYGGSFEKTVALYFTVSSAGSAFAPSTDGYLPETKPEPASEDNGAPDAGGVNPFIDVHADDWFYDDVEYAYERGLFTGTSENTFSPALPMTRAMFVTVLYRLAGSPGGGEEAIFTDVMRGTWYAEAVDWAAQNRIADGIGDRLFAPDAAITREQMAALLLRYARPAERKLPVLRPFIAFADEGDISEYASEAIETLYCAGIINGRPGNLFDPKGIATRAEVAAMLHRFMEATKTAAATETAD
ncbi:MAG: S-layer homology domain-containing protein [Clostridiales Family XIII bacterium]|nr:S-layer homology domain-containing protein [Clostridiales Family XIII bacterium]